jgi:uncharacterized protein (TIGR00730 family)
MHNTEISALLAAITAERPQSKQRRALLERLLEHVVQLAEQDPDTLDLKIAETALSELVEAFEVFAPYRDVMKVTIFGSARTKVSDPLYNLARDFGEAIARQGWMVVTGAGPGIMAAGMEGAGREHSFGVNIKLPHEQGANEFIASDVKLVEMRYFFTRKVALTKESKAFVAFPGGFGTLDEIFELLTLLQNGKATPAPVVLMDTPEGTFWRGLLDFVDNHVARPGYISQFDEGLFSIACTPADAVAAIESFYVNYHSMRMVGATAVLRMKRAPAEADLARINERFGHISLDGRIDVIDATDQERASNDELGLRRIALQFDRRSYGELRALINDINSW